MGLSITYKRIPIFDNKGENIIAHFESAFNFIEHAKHYGNILVHCHKGVSRSATIVIGYLMMNNKMTLSESFNHVKSCRQIVNPNMAFWEQLQDYDLIQQEKNNAEIQSEELSKIAGPSIGPSFPSSFPSVEDSARECQLEEKRNKVLSIGQSLPASFLGHKIVSTNIEESDTGIVLTLLLI